MYIDHLRKLQENIYKCMGCGICRGVWERQDQAMCPAWGTGIGFEDVTPRGRVTMAQDLLEEHFPYSRELALSVFRCTDCGCCARLCDAMDPKTGKPIVNVPAIVTALRMDLVDNALVPPLVRDYFKALYVNGNPYKIHQSERGDWAADGNIEPYAEQEFLLYVGDVGSFDELGQGMARAVAGALRQAGVSFGILGKRETSDGNEVRSLGEAGLFEFLAQNLITTFREVGVNKVICLDPHSLNAFRQHYPGLGGDFETFHYTEILAMMLRQKRLQPGPLAKKVTYHDPCYLGRHNEIYDAPREILRAIPSLELVEMERNRKNAFCCGGGGGNFFTDMLGGGALGPNRVRIREALRSGAQTLAVACPSCFKMLYDAIQDEGVAEQLEIKDVAGLLLDSLQ